ncbi:FtsX-like permease family protein [Streptomyces sp. NPDC058385]|uniref:FtsX-like permease family protein n=1 Tax=Streptomyces sp. NPDC058385 TaxID=3346473 RepID=UPI00365BCC06
MTTDVAARATTRPSVRTDTRLAWTLVTGSDRRERWRLALTAFGAALATVFCLGAAALAALTGHQVSVPYGNGLLDEPGTRQGVVVALLLLLVPVAGLLGQCARVGAVHRDRRLAALRLAGAGPRQVRRIAALESGLACLTGSVLALIAFGAMLATTGYPVPTAWAGFAAVALAVPAAGAGVSVFALRRVVASPLGQVRRVTADHGPGFLVGLIVPVLLVVAGSTLLVLRGTRDVAAAPLMVCAVIVVTGGGAVWVAGASSRLIGARLARRGASPAVIIAANRLRQDAWAAARTHAAVLLVTVVGVAFVGIREVLLDDLHRSQGEGHLGMDLSYYTFGIDLTGGAVLVALAISLFSLAVGTAESVATRRRTLAAQAASGVPHRVLVRALLLETALPLAPAVVLATLGGTAVHVAYAAAAGGSVPVVMPLLVPPAVYAACVGAAAASLPLLRRSVHPSELRAG